MAIPAASIELIRERLTDARSASCSSIGTTKEGHEISGAVAVVCWAREAPKGSPFRRVAGFQFRFADSVERQQMQDYVANIKKRYKL